MSKSRWDKIITFFAACSELANVGIVIEIVGKICPRLIILIGSVTLAYLAAIADPAIYCFKALIRLTRLIARSCNGKVDDEKLGAHKWQTAGDILSLGLFSVAASLLLGFILTGPVGITLGWVLALSGLSVVGYFDYVHQETLAYENFQQKHDKLIAAITTYEITAKDSLKSSEATKAAYQAMVNARRERDEAHQDYVTKRTSKRLYLGLLVGLAFLFICGSAAVFAPPLIAPILYIASQIASGYLGVIAVGRFLNWSFSKNKKVAKPTETPSALHAPDQTLTSTRRAFTALTHDHKPYAPQDAPSLTALSYTEVLQAALRYAANKNIFASDESCQLLTQIQQLQQSETPSDQKDQKSAELERDHKSMKLVNTYLNQEKNIGRTFYHILSETISNKIPPATPAAIRAPSVSLSS